MIIYESGRLCEAYLYNVPASAAALILKVNMSIQECRLASARAGHQVSSKCGLFCKAAMLFRETGRLLLDPSCLTFVHLRFDSRRDGLLNYAIPAQQFDLSGFTPGPQSCVCACVSWM